MRIKYFFILILGVLSMLSAKSSAPDWVYSGEHNKFDRKAYFIGTGQGASYAEAQSNATAGIASQLKVTIESTIEILTKETQSNGEIDFSEDVEQSTKASIDETLQGVEVVEQAKDGNVYYVFAVLNKAKFFLSLKTELDVIDREVESSLQLARNNMSNGQVFSALENFNDAYSKTMTYYTKRGFLRGLAPKSYLKDPSFSPAEVVGEIRKVLSSINVEIASGDNQTGELGKLLADPIEFIVKYSPENGASVVVPNVNITVRSGTNDILERVVTNSNGIAEVYIKAVPESGQRGRIKAILNLKSLAGDFSKSAKSLEVSAKYSVEKSVAIATSLSIKDENGKIQTSIEKNVSRALSQLHFKVNRDAPYSIIGTVTKMDENEVSGFSGTQYQVNVELILELYDNSTDSNISSVVMTGLGMSPKNFSAALKAAYGRLRIDKRKIAELMESVTD